MSTERYWPTGPMSRLLALFLLVVTMDLARSQDLTPALRSEFLMQLSVELETAQTIGDTPLGSRRIVYVKGGSFSGPRVNGVVLPGGGDWVLVRRDGVSQLDVRLTLRSEDGALIYMTYRGISDIAPEVRQRILKGEDVRPSEYYFRTSPMFETASEKHLWLNRLIAVGVGRRTPTSVVYDVFAIK